MRPYSLRRNVARSTPDRVGGRTTPATSSESRGSLSPAAVAWLRRRWPVLASLSARDRRRALVRFMREAPTAPGPRLGLRDPRAHLGSAPPVMSPLGRLLHLVPEIDIQLMHAPTRPRARSRRIGTSEDG